MIPAAFSFDIEEHDRIEAAAHLACPPGRNRVYADRMAACTEWILEALDESGAKATFFIVGEIATSHPQLIRSIAGAGHEVASHSWDHRRIHRFDAASFRDDLRRSMDALQQVTGQAVVGFRAPTFSLMRETAWGVDVLAEAGLRYDSSIFPVRHDRYGVADAPRFPFLLQGRSRTILELPPVTLGLGNYNLPAAGGGYFRLFPPAILHAAARQTWRQSRSTPVLYFHPWEFDPHQPQLPLKPLSRFRTYVGIPRSRARLRSMLRRYRGVRMIDLADGFATAENLPVFSLETVPGSRP
jgi:polysaccharide deacetylase family protein (PEP-CTERM system associated)